MKKIKIFLASSIEDLRLDRTEIGDFFNRLNGIYLEKGIFFSLIKCENYDNAISMGGKQDEYDREIEDSELCFFLFFRKVGDYTKHEFEVAMESFRQKNKPKIITYFKEVVGGDEACDAVKLFMKALDEELHHYYNLYGHIDTLKLGILMQIKLMGLDKSEICITDGNVNVNGEYVMGIDNVPLLNGNVALRTLTEKKRKLKEVFDEKKKAFDSDKSSNAEAELFKASEELNNVADALEAVEKKTLEFTAEVFKMMSDGAALTKRQRKALEFFNKGEYENAKAVLEDEEREKELETAKTIADGGKSLIIGYIEEEKLWIEAELASGIGKYSCDEIIKRYDKIMPLVEEYNLDKKVMCEYAIFLKDHNQNPLPISEKLNAYYSLSGDIPPKDRIEAHTISGSSYEQFGYKREAKEHYLKALELSEEYRNQDPEDETRNFLCAVSNDNLGNFYKYSKSPKDAEPYHRTALDIFKQLAAKSPGSYDNHLAACYDNIGVCYMMQELPEKALLYQLPALELFKKLANNPSGRYKDDVAICCGNISATYVKMEDYEKAKEKAEEALAIAKELAKQNPMCFYTVLSGCYHDLGGISEKTNEYKKAEDCYLEAIKILKTPATNDGGNVALAKFYTVTARLYGKWKEKKHKAAIYYYKAIELYRKLREKDFEAFNPALAACYFCYAYCPHSEPHVQATYIKEALRAAKQMPDDPVCKVIIEHISKI